MRNLKRALSLALAAVMLVGMMVTGASAAGYNEFTDREEIVNKDAVSMLTTLGVIEGMEDGSYFDPTGPVTREQMAKMISVIMNQGADVNNLYSDMKSGLTDVGASWAKGHINFCYSQKIIAGRGDGRFDPTANVTAAEAAKMLLVAAGYDPKIEGFEGADWAMNTSAKASKLGIYDNYSKPTTDPLSRDDAALLIYNALDIEMIQKYEDGYAINFADRRTILSAMYGVYKVEGVVVANKWAELDGTDSDAALKDGKTILDNVRLYASTTASTDKGEVIENGNGVPFNVDTSVDMLGKTVTLYIKKTTILSDSTVLGVTLKDNVNVINTSISNQDTAKSFLKGTGVAVDGDTEYYVNYGYFTDEASALAYINAHTTYSRNNKFDLNGITAEVIDNNDDGDAEYVLYRLETLSGVRSYSAKNETVSFYTPYDKDGKLTTDGGKSVTEKADFEDVVFEDEVTTDDLILYVQYGGRTYITVPEIVSGKMTRVDRDKNNELYITVEGETYKQSFILDAASLVDVDLTHFDIGNANKTPGFDTKYDFILDSTGDYVVAVRPAEETVTNYALVLGSAWTQNALTKSGELKVLMADGTEKTYDINWKGSVGTNKAFATDAALEDYLGTRDVLGGRNTGAGIGTVITYSLSDDDVLTIKNVLNLNTLADGTGTAAKGDFVTVDDAAKPIAYITYNNAASQARNLQYKLTNDYDAGDGSLDVTVVDTTDGADTATKTYAVDKDTVAFYYVDGDNYGVATGWDHMGDVTADTAVQVYPVMQKDGKGGTVATNLIDVALFNAVSESNSNSYMLVLNANYYTASDKLWLNVVFEDGETKEIEVKDDGGYDFDTDKDTYMNAYAYTVNSDGTYDVVRKSVVSNADAYLIKNGTVAWGAKYYSMPESVSPWDVTDVSSADDDVEKGTFTYNDVNAVVITTGSKNQTIRTAWIWDKEEGKTDDPTLPTAYKPVIESSAAGVITIRKYWGDTLSSQQIAKIIREQLTDVRVDKVSVKYDSVASKYVATVTDTTGDEYYYDVTYKNLAMIQYNSVTRYMAQGDTLDLTSQSSSKILAKAVNAATGAVTYTAQSTGVSGNVYTQPALGNSGAGVAADNLVLVDGYKVEITGSGASATYFTKDGKAITAATISSKPYIAAGDVLKVAATATNTATLTGDVDSKVIGKVDGGASGANKDFTMPTQNVTLNGAATPTRVAISATHASNVFTGTHGSYKLSYDVTGETGEKLIVRVETTTVNTGATLTLTVAGTGASVSPASVTVNAGTPIGTSFEFELTVGTADITLTLADT